jgi:hypothetical protein
VPYWHLPAFGVIRSGGFDTTARRHGTVAAYPAGSRALTIHSSRSRFAARLNFGVMRHWRSRMTGATEKQLDAALEQAFLGNAVFTQWFLGQTKFSGYAKKPFFSRSDHPWGRVVYTATNPHTGISETSIKESETDVLVVFRAPDGKVFALHIENKTGAGKFTPLQPELYALRAEQWAKNPKYGYYTDFETVLVAPHAFFQRNEAAARSFDRFISHEDIAAFIPAFGGTLGGA